MLKNRLFCVLFFTVSISGVFAQLSMDFFPFLRWDDAVHDEEKVEPSLKEFYDWYDRPPLLSLALDLEKSGFRTFLQLELRTDLMADLIYSTNTNFPYIDGSDYYADPNYPQTGYLEYRNDFITASFGRRKLDWGPGYYGLGISGLAPYFDNFWLEGKFPAGFGAWDKKGRLEYNFVVISTDYRAVEYYWDPDDGSDYYEEGSNGWKTFAAKRFSYVRPRFRASIMDYTLISNHFPNFQDLGAVLVYHSNYQGSEDHNVMLGLAAEGLITPNFRLYGEWLIDDFQVSFESVNSNPGAMGAILGFQWQILEGEKFDNPLLEAEDHRLKEDDFEFNGGLVFRLESLWTSRYLYGRNDEIGTIGEFTNPLYYMWMESKDRYVTTYFGAAYGPDSLIERVELCWDSHPFQGEFYFEYMAKGSFEEEGEYSAPYDNWIILQEPISHIFRLGVSGSWMFKNNMNAYTSLMVDIENGEPVFNIGTGVGIKLF